VKKYIVAIILMLLLSNWAMAQDNSTNAPGHQGEKTENKGDKGDDRGKDKEKEKEKDKDKEKETPKRPDDHDDKAPVQIGWAVISGASTGGTVSNLVAFATFGLKRGDETAQAGILPSDLTLSSLIYVSTNGRLSRNIGIAITNPSTTADAIVTMTLHDENGKSLGTRDFTVEKGHQSAQFVTSVFAEKKDIPKDLTGSVSITSTIPVSVIGLRFRGANFSTIPVTNLSPASSTGIVIPEFAAGGGWATELVLVNAGRDPITARADFFTHDGKPMTVRLNGQSKSSFSNLVIPAGGVLELAPKNGEGDSRF
jgi:hypothetical protein